MSRVEAQLTPERFARERDALIGRIAAGSRPGWLTI
jgi:hypothetical protein